MANELTGIRDGNVVFLVHPNREPARVPRTAAPPPKQLAMEFDGPHQLVVVVTDRLHGATFLRCLLQAKPKMLLDFRFAPHFRFTAIDGTVVKHQIDAVGARYVQCSIPFHEFGPSLLKHDPKGIAFRLPEFARATGSLEGPFMVLIKEAAMAHALSPFLLGALHHNLGGRWALEVIT